MINEQINTFSVDEGLTQVASYFNIVDNAVKTGDTNKRYTISNNASVAPSTPFPIGSWTTVTISPQADNMCDLYNSFITVEMNLGKFTGTNMPAVKEGSDDIAAADLATKYTNHGMNVPGYWIGFKDAMDAVEQYQILANGQAIYTQSNAIEESYITNVASTQAVKRVDIFSKATHKDAWNAKDTCRCGTVVNKYNYNTDEAHIITLKIDLRRFLPLASIKYIPEFVGNLQLRIKFGIAGLVCTPLSTEYVCGTPFNLASASYASGENMTNKFVPFSELQAGTLRGITAVSINASTHKSTITMGTQGAIDFASDNDRGIKTCFSH